MVGIVYRFENETLAGKADAASAHDTLTEVDLDDCLNLLAKLPQYALRNAKWYCSQAAFAQSLLAIAAAGGVSSLKCRLAWAQGFSASRSLHRASCPRAAR